MMKDRTHSCLSLGPSGNLQGSLKCFDILTGKVATRRTIKVLLMPDRFLKTLNMWGLTSRTTFFEDKLEFLNRIKSKYDWDNDDIVDDEEGLVDPEPTHTRHHGILSEIPRVDLESDEADESENKTENPIVPAVPVLPDWSDRANAARDNSNLISTAGVVDEQIPRVNMYHEVDTDVEDDVNCWRHVKYDNKADWRLLDEIVEESVEAPNDELPPESQYGRGQRV